MATSTPASGKNTARTLGLSAVGGMVLGLSSARCSNKPAEEPDATATATADSSPPDLSWPADSSKAAATATASEGRACCKGNGEVKALGKAECNSTHPHKKSPCDE